MGQLKVVLLKTSSGDSQRMHIIVSDWLNEVLALGYNTPPQQTEQHWIEVLTEKPSYTQQVEPFC